MLWRIIEIITLEGWFILKLPREEDKHVYKVFYLSIVTHHYSFLLPSSLNIESISLFSIVKSVVIRGKFGLVIVDVAGFPLAWLFEANGSCSESFSSKLVGQVYIPLETNMK